MLIRSCERLREELSHADWSLLCCRGGGSFKRWSTDQKPEHSLQYLISLMPSSQGVADVPSAERIRQIIDLTSATLMAVATVATAWCGYQSALWGGEEIEHHTRSLTAIIRTGKFANLAAQKTALHATMFGQWEAAVATNNTTLADFLFNRLPEPLKAATVAWRATRPLSNPHAPATPFDTREYVLDESAEAARWEEIGIKESAAADRASDISDRYLVFTIIFASVLFFAGISGKFGWQPCDVTVLVLGALTLVTALVIMLGMPRM